MSLESLNFILVAFSSVFVVVDPIGNAPVFVTITASDSRERRLAIAKRASLTAFLTMAAFAMAGGQILRLFGITIGAFRVAGGIILFGMALGMLRVRALRETRTPEEVQEATEKEDTAVFPLAIPLLSGPGAITTVMVLMGQARVAWHRGVVIGAIAVTCGITYLLFRWAGRVIPFLGRTGLAVSSRVMGLLLAVISVQFVADGVRDLLPLILKGGPP